jgi:hypothetical protein
MKRDVDGQLGDNTTVDRYTPVQVHGKGGIEKGRVHTSLSHSPSKRA